MKVQIQMPLLPVQPKIALLWLYPRDFLIRWHSMRLSEWSDMRWHISSMEIWLQWPSFNEWWIPLSSFWLVLLEDLSTEQFSKIQKKVMESDTSFPWWFSRLSSVSLLPLSLMPSLVIESIMLIWVEPDSSGNPRWLLDSKNSNLSQKWPIIWTMESSQRWKSLPKKRLHSGHRIHHLMHVSRRSKKITNLHNFNPSYERDLFIFGWIWKRSPVPREWWFK